MFVPQALIQTIAFEITFALGETEKRRIVWKEGWLSASSERQAVRSHNTRPTFYSSLFHLECGWGGLGSQSPASISCANSPHDLLRYTSAPPLSSSCRPPALQLRALLRPPDPVLTLNVLIALQTPLLATPSLSARADTLISHITPATFSPAVRTCLHVRFPTSSPLSDCWPWAPPDTR